MREIQDFDFVTKSLLGDAQGDVSASPVHTALFLNKKDFACFDINIHVKFDITRLGWTKYLESEMKECLCMSKL